MERPALSIAVLMERLWDRPELVGLEEFVVGVVAGERVEVRVLMMALVLVPDLGQGKAQELESEKMDWGSDFVMPDLLSWSCSEK